MMHVWSHRPQFLHLGLFVAAYVLGCGFAQSLAIVPGTGISIWPPGGLFVATLILASRRSWPWWVLAGCVAELFSNALWFHSPLPAALLIYTGNALEAAAGAWLLNRTFRRPVRLETLREVLAFVLLAAGIAPVVGATVGSATLAWFGIQSQSFAAAWPLWWIGDATGVLIVAPLALAVFQNWRGKVPFSAARWMEAGVLGLVFVGVAALSLSGYLPFAYIIMPPLLWAAVRFEFRGAAVALILLALITTVFTLAGVSQFAGDAESQRQRQVMLQLFLAISAFSALIVAAISRQHQLALLTLRQNVQALRDREQELSQLVDMVPSHVWRLTPDGEPVFFNKRMVDFLGLDVADTDTPGMSRLEAVLETVHPDDAPKFRDAINRCLVTGEGFALRYRLRRADGVYRWMSSRAEPMRDQGGRIVQWYGLCHDIDDQMHAEEALRRSEQRLQQLIDTVPAVIWRATAEGKLSYVNKRLTEVVGLTLEDLAAPDGRRSLTAFHPDDREAVDQAMTHSIRTGASYVMRYRQLRRDGSYRWVETRAEPLRDEFGAIVEWYAVSVDIHDMVRAQEALRERERELQQLIDAVPVRIWSATPAGGAVYFNKRYQDHLRSTIANFDALEDASIEKFIQELIHPEDAPGVQRTLGNSFETGAATVMRFRWREKDGVYRWAECRVEPRRDHDGTIVQWYGVSLDIDDEVRAQEALRQASDRLAQAAQAASLAELSASIAHEVNQPLAAIVANSHACHRWLSADPPNLERAKITSERITRDANSAAEVVSRIRALFRHAPDVRSFEDVNRVVEEVCRLMAEEIAAKDIRIETDLDQRLPPVALDRVQAQQVLVNLIRNGIEAMDGQIDGARALQIRSRRDGADAIRIEVRDAGMGFTDAERVFEPFFTTKQHGMGMGLAICRSIIESHGGRLWAANNETHGATVAFTLPLTESETP
jgi:PAS domain S-box-containing protein